MASTKKTAKAKATTTTKRLPRKVVKLAGANATNTLTLIAAQLKSGTFRSQVIARNGDERKRGMTATHDSLEAAIARIDALVDEAVEAGWIKKSGRLPKEPAFTSIPKPLASTAAAQ
jgi:hypothetical protein